MHRHHYDVIVIGSGAGVLIARAAAARGMRVALVEQGPIGGTCLNRGCIPSKMLIYPADLVRMGERAPRLNVVLGATARIDFSRLIERIGTTIRGISAELRTELHNTDTITLYESHAQFVDNRTIVVNDRHITAPRIFIAAGARPRIPDIAGLADTPYMTSTDALRCTTLPRRLLVIGGGYIAVELGHAYAAAGAEVHFVVRSQVLRTLDRHVAMTFTRAFRRNHHVHEGWTPETVTHDGATFTLRSRDQRGRPHELQGDGLLIATGVTPCSAALGLEHTDITTSPEGFIAVDAHLQTRVDGVYALGDIAGKYLFRHTANHEARYLVRHVIARETAAPIQYGPVPYAVFSDPQIAGVGATEEQLIDAGIAYRRGVAAYADSTPGMCRGADQGLVKLLLAPGSGTLLGAHIVGDEASDLIHLLIGLMHKKGTLADLQEMIFIHPALPEVIRDAARQAHP